MTQSLFTSQRQSATDIEPLPFDFRDTLLSPPLTGHEKRLERAPSYPSIQSILSVTGTIDIDKFNRGFEDVENTSKKSIGLAEEETRPNKRPRLLSAKELLVDTEEVSESRKPVSLWFKKQLVIQLVKEIKMDLSSYGYKGKADNLLWSCGSAQSG